MNTVLLRRTKNAKKEALLIRVVGSAKKSFHSEAGIANDCEAAQLMMTSSIGSRKL
jgi:hypothetical protein